MSSVANLAGARAIERIMKELQRAEDKHPGWHQDPLRQVAIISEESGEAMQATLNQLEYSEAAGIPMVITEDILKEVAQTGAMALRYLLNYEQNREEVCSQPTATAS